MGYSNPNVAKGVSELSMTSPVPNKATVTVYTNVSLQNSGGKSVSTNYMCSNTEAVKGLSRVYASQAIDGRSMQPKGSTPSFEKLQPKAMSTNPGKMGTNYKS